MSMTECDCDPCWFCEYCFVIDAYSIGCKAIVDTGHCAFEKGEANKMAERKEK